MQTAPDRERFDLAIAGAGIFGLSIAHAALKAGLSVAVIDASTPGAGASGGLLGALMPHMPARWNPKKEFQFQALAGLEQHVRALEKDTGLQAGYRRCGRILPLTTQDRLDHHLERAEESTTRWHPETTGFRYRVEPSGSRSSWLSPQSAPFGLVFETLAARVSPRAYLATLAAYVRAHGRLFEHTTVTGFDETSRAVSLSNSDLHLRADRLVLASGHAVFPAIEHLTGQAIGRGEKGQALLMEGTGLEDQPAIYCDGLYVVPHDNGTVAIGSTSDRDFDDNAPDPLRTQELIDRATAFCPSLSGRAVIAEWAGIRPRCNKRDPMIGRLPGRIRTFAATGGYKISFGIAHLVADGLVAELAGRTPHHPLPDTFRPEHHFGVNALHADRAG